MTENLTERFNSPKERTNWCAIHGNYGITESPEGCPRCTELLPRNCTRRRCANPGKLRGVIFTADVDANTGTFTYDRDLSNPLNIPPGIGGFVRCESLGILCGRHFKEEIDRYNEAAKAWVPAS